MALTLLPTPLQLPKHRHHSLRIQPLNSTSSSSFPPNPNNIFLDPKTLTQLQIFTAFRHTHKFPHGGRLEIRPLTTDSEADAIVTLLADSFSQSVKWAPARRYAQLVAFLVKRYVYERRRMAPHAAILVGFYKKEEEESEEAEVLACTAEVSLDAVGSPGGLPTPMPPPDCPYVCNMTVEMSLRRYCISQKGPFLVLYMYVYMYTKKVLS